MRFLVLEGDEGVADAIDTQLGRAGHETVRCREVAMPAFTCKGMSGGECPLDEGDVDAALYVGVDTGGERGRDGEEGARCALRRRIPLVVTPTGGSSSLEPWAAAVIDDRTEIAAGLESVARAPLPQHSSVAQGAFAGVLESHGLSPDLADAVVHRRAGSLRVELQPGIPLPSALLETASVRVAGAIRSFDPFARTIDVAIG